MQVENPIINELSQISAVVANIQKQNVFAAPTDYFEQFPAQMLMLVSDDIQLKNVNHKTNFSVPQGYFDGLADSILSKIKSEEYSVSEEWNEHSEILSKIGKANVFTVPEGYFESNGIGFFDAAAAETNAISSVVNDIERKNVFQVPNGYFESLSSNILYTIDNQEKDKAPVVAMKPKRKVFFPMAIAASIIALVAFAGFFFWNNNNQQTNILNSPVYSQAQQIIKQNSFDQELNALSADDIEQYLQDRGQDVQSALVAEAATSDENLPEAIDYMLDDKTLDKYLKQYDLSVN